MLLLTPNPAAGLDPLSEPESGLDIRFDFEVVDRFLEFVHQGEVAPADLDRWIRLQGNRELLRRDRRDSAVSVEALKTAIRTIVKGEVFPGAGSLGRLDTAPWAVLRGMVDSIRQREDALQESVERSLAPYLPAGRPLPPMRVFFHLGGSWDGRTSDHVYINLTYFQERGPAGLPGLDALLVHELYHRVQATLLGSIDDYSSRNSALYTIMMRIQKEGTSRHLEYLYLQEGFPASALDRTNFEKYRQGLRTAAGQAAVLEEIVDRVVDGRRLEARRLTDLAVDRGGPLYAIGHAMAAAIDENLGPAAVARTAAGGPAAFFDTYAEAVDVAGQTSILPARFTEQIAAIDAGYRASWLDATRLRRIGLRALLRDDIEAAVEALERAVRLDPSDAISAYNLACALGLEVVRTEALPWRPEALERYAREGTKRAALRSLEEALRRGFDDDKLIRVDPDLDSLRDHPEFRAILERYGIDNDTRSRGED